MSGDHSNYCIFEISQNTEESPRDLRRFAVTQTPVKANADGKNSQGENCNNNNNNKSSNGLEDLEIGDRVEIILTTALLKTVRILRRVLET